MPWNRIRINEDLKQKAEDAHLAAKTEADEAAKAVGVACGSGQW